MFKEILQVIVVVLLVVVVVMLGTATKLQTARSINGTNFDGSGNITTSKWGTSRTIALSGAVSGSANVDGSGNVTITTTQANVTTITGNITGNNTEIATGTFSYPQGYTQNNCIIIGYVLKNNSKTDWKYGSTFDSGNVFGTMPLNISLNSSNISVNLRHISISNGSSPSVTTISSSTIFNIKIMLMKI